MTKKTPISTSKKTTPAGRKAKRRQEILAAALAIFADDGFAAARLDDIARHAGVAKGTLYLYFNSKEALFEELLREAIKPMQGRLARIAADPRINTRDALNRLFDTFRRDIAGSDGRLVLWLLLAEGRRFPKLTAFYHREVLLRVVPMLKQILARGLERGEIANTGLINTPQLVMAPAFMAIIWQELFGAYAPLELDGLFETHIDLLTGVKTKDAPQGERS